MAEALRLYEVYNAFCGRRSKQMATVLSCRVTKTFTQRLHGAHSSASFGVCNAVHKFSQAVGRVPFHANIWRTAKPTQNAQVFTWFRRASCATAGDGFRARVRDELNLGCHASTFSRCRGAGDRDSGATGAGNIRSSAAFLQKCPVVVRVCFANILA